MEKLKNVSPSLKNTIINSFQSGLKQSDIARRSLRQNRRTFTVSAEIKRYWDRCSLKKQDQNRRNEKLSVQDDRNISYR